MAVWLSLLAAALYGSADFIGGTASKRAPAWSVAFTAAVGGGVAVLGVALVVGGDPRGIDLAWAVLAGVGNGVGTAFLYRGLATGRMGVVAPVSGVGAVVLPVLVGLALGERPGAVVWAGLLVAVPAIWLVSREPGGATSTANDDAVRTRLPAGAVVDGLLAGAGFGTLFVGLAQIRDDAGLLPLALNQAVAAVVVVVGATALGASWVPRQRASYVGVLAGALGAGATGLFMVATRYGYLAVAAVLTSLYPAFTVLLAAVVLRERIHREQGLGLLLCAGAVALVAVG